MIAAAREFVPDAGFVVMSGYSEFSYVSRAIGLGVLDYLEKPITMKTITHCLLNAGNTCSIRKRNNGLLADNLQLKKQSMAHALEQFLTGGNYQELIRSCGLTGEWEYFMAARNRGRSGVPVLRGGRVFQPLRGGTEGFPAGVEPEHRCHVLQLEKGRAAGGILTVRRYG